MLLNTLSLLWAFTSLIGPLEVGAITVATLALIYSLTPPPDPYWTPTVTSGLYRFLHASWLGRVALWQAFWPFFILFNAALLYIDYRAVNGTYTIASWVTVHIILAMPLIYWTGAVWRNSGHCSHRLWSVAARLATVLAYYDYLLRWIIRHDYPQLLFNCRQLVIEFGDCVF